MRSPVKKREREAKPKTATKEDTTSGEEEVVPLKKRMRGAVKPMPVPPKQKTPPPSPIQIEYDQPPVSTSVNVGNFNDLN